MDDFSAPTILLSMDKDTIKDTDDFTLKITDSDKYNPQNEMVDNYILHFDYTEDKIFLKEKKEYICHLYKNGVEIPHFIEFTITNEGEDIIPENYYSMEITGDNSFSISNNKMYNKDPLKIEAQVNINGQILKDNMEIWLGGLF